MSPLTKAVNKQLLPLYDKPLIYYPLSVLMLAGIKDILIIVNKGQLNQFQKILPKNNYLGLNINYEEQSKPRGLPEAFIIGEKFIGGDNVALVLGDNFFYGQNFTMKLRKCIKLKKGATVFVHPVKNPNFYGVAKINSKNKILKLIEKPKKFISNLAVTGLYFFDNNVIKFSKTLRPSRRKEIEITDLLNIYRKKNVLNAEVLGRGGVWLDTGSIEDFYSASNFISTVENRQGFKIACIEEISLNNKWIKDNEIKKQISFYGNCEYSKYLKNLIL